MEKVYACIDLKSFYASVECVKRKLDPLKTNLVVADKSRTEKTICLAVSPSLKKYGIPGRARLFEVISKVKEINNQSKLVAAICHGAQVMISADILKGKALTCFVGIRDDVINSGGDYRDEEVVVDANLVTSRTPKDEPAFIREILAKLN